MSLRDRQRGDGPQEIETFVCDVPASVVVLAHRTLPKLHGEAPQALPVQVQGRSVEVARRRLHLPDLRPSLVHPHERLLGEVFGLADPSGQQEHRSDEPDALVEVEVLELDRSSIHIRSRLHRHTSMNPQPRRSVRLNAGSGGPIRRRARRDSRA